MPTKSLYDQIWNICVRFVNLCIFPIWKILATPGRRKTHPGRLIIEINLVWNVISDNFHSYHKAVRPNMTELFFLSLMNKLKLRQLGPRIFWNLSEKVSDHPKEQSCQVSCSYTKMQRYPLHYILVISSRMLAFKSCRLLGRLT